MIVLNFIFIITGLILCGMHLKFRDIDDVFWLVIGGLSIGFNGADVLQYFNLLS